MAAAADDFGELIILLLACFHNQDNFEVEHYDFY